jgi:hypothetical protein
MRNNRFIQVLEAEEPGVRNSVESKVRFLLLALLVCGMSVASVCQTQLTFAETEKDPNSPLHAYNANALHRLDFRVVGKSCAVCLHRMQERMKELNGTVRAEVMMKKPYGVVVVYDSTKVKADKILDKCKEGVPEVTLVDVKDTAIKKIPIVLVPAAASEAADKNDSNQQ